jgi:hypothetical protein
MATRETAMIDNKTIVRFSRRMVLLSSLDEPSVLPATLTV